MEQDLTFVVNRCQPILDAVKAENSPLVQKVTVLGTYSDITGKTITIRLSFSHPERTSPATKCRRLSTAWLRG